MKNLDGVNKDVMYTVKLDNVSVGVIFCTLCK